MFALYSTWLLLLLLALIIYSFGVKDISGPSFLLTISFFLAYTVVIYNTQNWDIKIHGYFWKTSACVLFAILAFTLGSIAINSFSKNHKESKTSVLAQRTANYPYILFLVLSLILFFLFLRFKIGSISLSSLSSFRDWLRNYYSTEKEYNFLTTQILEALVAIAYISFHRVMLEHYYLKTKINKLLFLPIIILLFATLLYTDRNILLRFMIFAILAVIMSYNWKSISSKSNVKILARVAVAVVAISGLFWLYGNLKEYTSDFERMVGIYGGSGIYAFNLWLDSFDSHYTHGLLTFSTFHNTLNALGIGEQVDVSAYWNYITYASKNGYVFSTNIYSALRNYYQDFGYAGIVVIFFLLGALFEKLHQLALKDKFAFWWVFFCAHVYHIIYVPIAEQFFSRMHLGLVYEIFWIVFFYFFVYGKKGFWRYKVVVNYNMHK